MIRKFLSFLILLSIGMSFLSPSAFGEILSEIPFDEQMISDQGMGLHEFLQSEYDDASYELLKLKDGRKYKKQIDIFFLKNRTNTKRMRRLEEKLWEIQEKIYNQSASKKTVAIVNYMQAKLAIIMENIFMLEMEQEKEKQKKLAEERFKENISEREKKKVEKEILVLQKNLFEHGNDSIEKFLGDFEKYTKRKEIGNLEMNFRFDIENVGETLGKLKFSNYEAKSDMFDSQLTGHIDGFIKSTMRGEDINFQVESFIDFISKEGNMYLLLNKLNFEYTGKDENLSQEMAPYIERIKQYAKENMYIKFNDDETKTFLKQLEKINLKDFSKKTQIATEIPFFEAYKKVGNTYFLKPTKHFCSTIKDITERFDPFYGSKCSDGQYENMLADMANLGGELSLAIGRINTIRYSLKDGRDTFTAEIEYTKTYIDKVSINFIPNQEIYPNEGVNFEYKRKSHLNFNISADDIEVVFNGKITSKSKLNEIDSSIVFEGKKIGYLTLKNGDIKGNIDYIYQSYDWKNEEFTDAGRILLGLRGKWNGESFDTMDLELSVQDLRDTSNYGEIEISYGTTSRNSLKADGIISINGKEIFTIETDGNLEKNYLDIKSNILFKDSAIGFFFPNETEVNISLDIMSDLRDNKNNARIYIDATVGGKNPLEFEIKNTGTVTPFTGKIEAPKKFIEIKDIDDLKRDIKY